MAGNNGTATEKELPMWLQPHLNQAALERIRVAVQNAEISTSAEIVPMIVERSSVSGHVLPILFLLFSLIWVAVTPTLHLQYPNMSWFLLDAGGIFLSFFIAAFLARIPSLQRGFTAPADLAHQVAARAHLEFFNSNIKATRDSTGILIFMSLFERRAVVLADEAISKKFDDTAWTQVVEHLLSGGRKQDLAAGICKAIEHCGQLLAPQFPACADNSNELQNDLIYKK